MRHQLVIVLWALFLFGHSTWARAELRAELLTIGPGPAYFERFGHNAIVIRNTDTGQAFSYNFGIFDFEQENFFVNFLRGHMLYKLAVFDADRELAFYRSQGRDITRQKLNLTNDQVRALFNDLANRAKPENAEYRYDYFLSNCSTQVRDALDRATGGQIAQQSELPARLSLRDHTRRLTAPVPWMHYGIQFGLGPKVDQPTSRWDDFFVPMELQRAAETMILRRETGETVPFVAAQEQLFTGSKYQEQMLPEPNYWLGWLIGLLVFGALWLLPPRPANWLANGILVVWAVAGTFMLGLWLFTEHWPAARNAHLLLASPLLLAFFSTNRLLKTTIFAAMLAASIWLALPWNEQSAPVIAPILGTTILSAAWRKIRVSTSDTVVTTSS